MELTDPTTGEALHSSIRTRHQLMLEVCKIIPSLKSRTDPPKQPTPQMNLQQQLALQQAALAQHYAQPPPPPQKSGKKGRKKG